MIIFSFVIEIFHSIIHCFATYRSGILSLTQIRTTKLLCESIDNINRQHELSHPHINQYIFFSHTHQVLSLDFHDYLIIGGLQGIGGF